MRRVPASLVVALGISCAHAGDPPPPREPPLALVQTIALSNVTGRLDHMAIDAKRKRLFLAALGNGSVEVVSLEKGERVKTISALAEPQGVVYAAETDQLIIACGGDGSVRFHDGEKLEETAKVDLGSDADNARCDPALQRLFVGFGSGGVAVVPLRKPAVTAKVDLGAHPESLQLETAGRRMFVNVEDAAEVAVVDRFEMKVTARWKLGGPRANFPMALDEEGKRLFVGCRAPACLVTLSTTDGSVVATTVCSDDPDDVFVDAARRRVYVSCGAGTVDVFDRVGDSLELAGKIATRRGARTCLLDPTASRLYVAVPRDGQREAEIRVFAAR